MRFIRSLFKKKSPHYTPLQKKWAERHAQIKAQVVEKHKSSLDWVSQNLPQAAKEHIIAGSLSGLLLMAPPITAALPAPKTQEAAKEKEFMDVPEKVFLLSDLGKLIPPEMRPLTPEEEVNIGGLLTNHFGFTVTAELEGKKLNRSYGLIGAEQHLMRYPGDTMSSHFQTGDEEAMLTARSGMAPGRGAWGYFTNSYSEMTQKDIDREKYYLAVQTFLAPGFNENVSEYYNFFKYRKMLVVNPHNGKAMVVVIGDAGPAQWTGKHLGGSPEVMKYLERVDGKARGPVLYFFIDDPEDKIPLGPIE